MDCAAGPPRLVPQKASPASPVPVCPRVPREASIFHPGAPQSRGAEGRALVPAGSFTRQLHTSHLLPLLNLRL